MRTGAIERWTRDRNGKFDGGWVTVVCHPLFNIPRWLVTVERSKGDSLVIGSDLDIKQAMSQADQWLVLNTADDGFAHWPAIRTALKETPQ